MSHGIGPDPSASPAAEPPRGRLLRRAVSVWLLLHLTAVVIAPASVGPSSELVGDIWGLFQPYLEILYLDHGYHFFAPEPAESTLLAYEARRPDGTVVRGRIPDRAIAPRLLYHRYFMLTEHMSDSPEEFKAAWHESYARHIGRRRGAAEVTLIQQTHNLPSMERIRGGGRLSDPESYESQILGTFRCDGY